MKTPRVAIESLWLGLYDGPHATPKPSNDGPVFLGIGNLTEDGRLDLTDIRHIAEEDFGNWTRRVLPQGGDIVFTYEATLNRYAMIPEGFRGCLGRRLALIRPDSSKVNPRFLFFYFFGEDWRETISRNILSGATVDRIPLTTFPTFEVNLPSRLDQDRIVEILSAYDDLIENNTCRIKILEEIAQMIYREWFVNFRFPGHGRVKMHESELGAIPCGWTVGPLGDIAQIQWGDTSVTKTAYITEGGFRAFSASGPDGFMDYFDFDRTGIVLSAIGANCGLTWYASGKWSCIKNTICFWADEAKTTNEFLYFATKGKEFWPKRGSAQPFISQGDARAIKLLIPPHRLTSDYSEITARMISLAETLAAQNVNLRETRDLLIPKLISGEISVERLETEAAKQIKQIS